MTAAPSERLQRLEDVIEKQRAFLHRVPDPDTRQRAESHLLELVEMRDQLRENPASSAHAA